MGTAKAIQLESLRGQLTAAQRDVINAVWAHHLDQNRWMPRSLLHERLQPAAVGAAIQPLLGAILLPCEEDGEELYRLTFLGVLLTDQGPESEELLARYLEYIRDRVRRDPRVEWVTSHEVEAALGLSPERSRFLQRLIRLSHWWGGGGGFAEREWTVGVPVDVDDLMPRTDLRAYIQDHVTSHFLPEASRGIAKPLAAPPAPRSVFWFIEDAALSRQLAMDWHEAQEVYQVRCWKSCVLLAGGILEGMLLNALARGKPAASRPADRKTRPAPRPSDRWPLAKLLEAAVRRRILAVGTLVLGPALQEYGTLAHPKRQIGQGLAMTRDDADHALKTVRKCVRLLAARKRGKAARA